MSAYDPFGVINQIHALNGMDSFNRFVVDGNYIDGSWELSVFVEDLRSHVSVRVLGDLPLGGLMHKIVEKVKVQQSWSDHAIWWVDRNVWLLHSRTTLDQYGIQSDANLMFRRMHNDLQIILPSMTSIILRVNFATRVFNVVRNICKELNIRHSEELSLSIPITRNMLKTNCPLPTIRPGFRLQGIPLTGSRNDQILVRSKLMTQTTGHCVPDGQQPNPYATLSSNAGTMMRFKSDNSLDQERLDFAKYADCTLRRSAKAVFADNWLMKPRNLIHKARLNSGWLDSSRSLLEQGINPLSSANETTDNPPTLYLCFKYYTFYDVILKYDAVRIHQLYEQARWSLLSGLFDCTEDEMVVFAAYQLQAELQSAVANQILSTIGFPELTSSSPYTTLGASSTIGFNNINRIQLHASSSPDVPKKIFSNNSSYNGGGGSLSRFHKMASLQVGSSLVDSASPYPNVTGAVDEVDELLSELEQSCGVAEEANSVTLALQNSSLVPAGPIKGCDTLDTAEVPFLEGTVKVFRERTLLLKRYKAYWAILKETRLYLFRSQNQLLETMAEYSLRDCTVVPDVNVANQKFLIKLSVISETNRKMLNGTAINFQTGTIPREEIWLRFDSAEQYSSWLAACRLASRGKTLASRSTYSKEVDAILELLKLQMPGPTPAISPAESASYLGDLTDFCADRIVRKARTKDALRLRIAEAHVNIRDLSLLEAKYKYIQAWQRLSGFGKSYFIVQFERGSGIIPNSNTSSLFTNPQDDLIAISQGRIEVISPQTNEVLRAWNFSDLRSWNVNWDAEKVILEFRNSQISFHPLSTNCKTIVEFIGGYVFLSQRNLEKSQEVNERLFHRLTGVCDC